MERDKLKLAEQYFTQLASKHTAALDSLLGAALPDPAILLKLTGNCMQFWIRWNFGDNSEYCKSCDTLILTMLWVFSGKRLCTG